MSLKGKTLFITGASRGIGLAIALRAARDGANIAVAAKTADPHPKLPGTIYSAAEEIEAAGGKALPAICDIRDEQSVVDAVDAAVTIGHQVHGAIGFSRAYSLNFRTRRLMVWRDTFGSVPYWRRVLARSFIGLSADEVWPKVTAVQSSAVS